MRLCGPDVDQKILQIARDILHSINHPARTNAQIGRCKAPKQRAARDLGGGEVAELVTSHLPAPGIDILRAKGYRTWTLDEGPGHQTSK